MGIVIINFRIRISILAPLLVSVTVVITSLLQLQRARRRSLPISLLHRQQSRERRRRQRAGKRLHRHLREIAVHQVKRWHIKRALSGGGNVGGGQAARGDGAAGEHMRQPTLLRKGLTTTAPLTAAVRR